MGPTTRFWLGRIAAHSPVTVDDLYERYGLSSDKRGFTVFVAPILGSLVSHDYVERSGDIYTITDRGRERVDVATQG